MKKQMDRRDFMRLLGLGGTVVFASSCGVAPKLGTTAAFGKALASPKPTYIAKDDADFYFVQLSDTHWGLKNPLVNPNFATMLPNIVQAVNALEKQPDFVVFTGDLTNITTDAAKRRTLMNEFKNIIKDLKAPVRLLPGEHDASLDAGQAYKEIFGDTYYTFDHKSVHFIVLDNVSDPTGSLLGDTQLAWLKTQLDGFTAEDPIVVLTHRPLFPLYPQWDFFTKDGQAALDLLMPFQSVSVFYGHIHQENSFTTGHIQHHAGKSLMFAHPAPGSVPNDTQIPWDPNHPYQGLGFREILSQPEKGSYAITEIPAQGNAP
jgi:3',5'-cyclic AMP phosphodiesterase CpdA